MHIRMAVLHDPLNQGIQALRKAWRPQATRLFLAASLLLQRQLHQAPAEHLERRLQRHLSLQQRLQLQSGSMVQPRSACVGDLAGKWRAARILRTCLSFRGPRSHRRRLKGCMITTSRLWACRTRMWGSMKAKPSRSGGWRGHPSQHLPCAATSSVHWTLKLQVTARPQRALIN